MEVWGKRDYASKGNPQCSLRFCLVSKVFAARQRPMRSYNGGNTGGYTHPKVVAFGILKCLACLGVLCNMHVVLIKCSLGAPKAASKELDISSLLHPQDWLNPSAKVQPLTET